ncbi:MAG: type I-A CRISPR-associated protein Cas7/Csa2 [Desulfurococcaceae archaeon]
MNITLSLSVRVLVNAEALNMAESVGNYTRHRKAPIVFATSDGYTVVYAPAVSGEALAHGYQQLLVQIAKSRGLPVTSMDEQGYFLKFSSTGILDNWYPELQKYAGSSKVSDWAGKASLEELENAFLNVSVVADVGGFMLAERLLRRTSAIRFSYMVPTLDALETGGVSLIPQLHVRYAPPELVLRQEQKQQQEQEQKEEEEKRSEQAIIYVESGSALYTFTAELVASDIARLFYAKQQNPQLAQERAKRVEAAVDALIAMVDGLLFGAKRSRYMPLWKVKSIVVSVSKGPVEFLVSPGVTRSYVKETYDRAVTLVKAIPEQTVNIYTYIDENIEEPSVKADVKNVTYTKVQNHTEALLEAKRKLMNLISILQMAQ